MSNIFQILKKYLPYLLFLIFILLLLFRVLNLDISKRPIERWDEETNISVIDDSLNSNDRLILKYHDSESGFFFEKPPLWYWNGLLFSQLPGETYLNLRLMSTLFGVLMLVSTMLLSYLMTKNINSSISSGIILLSANHLFQINPSGIFSTHVFSSADIDMLLLLLIMLSFLFSYLYFQKNNKKFLFISGIFSGLAILTKGPIGFLPVIIFFLYLLIKYFRKFQNKDSYLSRRVKFKKLILEFVICAFGISVIVLSWHLFMYFKFSDLWLNEYFGYHILQRFTTPLEGHTGYPFMYLSIFLDPRINLFGIPTLLGIFYILFKKKTEIFRDFSLFFPVATIILLIIVLSLSKTQIAWYLLPIYPMEAILLSLLVSSLYPAHCHMAGGQFTTTHSNSISKRFVT